MPKYYTEYVRAYVVHTRIPDSRKADKPQPANVGFTKARLIKRANVASATVETPTLQPTIAKIERNMKARTKQKKEARRKPCAEWDALFKDDCE